jgi:hypothetical protein
MVEVDFETVAMVIGLGISRKGAKARSLGKGVIRKLVDFGERAIL